MLAVVEAAAASPTAAHRGFSIATIFDSVVRHRPQGARHAMAEDLPPILDQLPDMPGHEDFAPYDAREEVLVRWGGELFRVLPGSLERPTARLNQQALLAAAIDPVLVPRIGFGLADVGELILRRIDDCAGTLTQSWPARPPASVGDPASVSEAEVEAARTLPSFTDLPARCASPDRATAAATHFTVNVRDLARPSAFAQSTFGTAIATRHRGRVHPIPAAYLAEALPVIGSELAGQAAAADTAAERAFFHLIQTRVARRFRGSGQVITGPLQAGTDRQLHSLVIHNGRLVVALNVVASLTPQGFAAQLSAGDKSLRRVVPGLRFTTPTGSHSLPANAQIVRANVIAWPHPQYFHDISSPLLTLEDLEWILYTARQSPVDLWYFLRDLVEPAGIESMFAWDMIDRWEVWRHEKSFYRGGRPLSHLMFAPHEAAAEWQETAKNARLERALLHLGFPPLRDWPIVVPDHRNGAEVGDLTSDEVWQVLPQPIPAAVAKTDLSGPRERRSELWRFAVSVAWKLDHCADAFQAAAAASEMVSLQIDFAFQERTDGPPLTAGQADQGALTLRWDSRLQTALTEDSFAVEQLAGELVAEAFFPAARSAFVQAWQAAPPGIRVDGFQLNQKVQRLPAPITGHESIRADVLRRLGEFLAAEQFAPGLLADAAATRFESRTVFPWLMTRFHEAIAGLSADALLGYALGQLERVHHQRFMLDKRIGWERGFPTGDEIDRSDEIGEVVQQMRVISLIVEEVLAHPPAGDEPVDDVAWIEVVSVAELCLDSCVRSAAIHNQLTRTAAKITDYYEVQTVTSDEPTDLDFARYQHLRTQHLLPAPIPIAIGQANAHADNDEPPAPIADRVPELKPIDEALRSALDFGIDAVLGVLEVATQWHASVDAPAALVAPAEVIDECVQLITQATRPEFTAALEWLTLHGHDLAADVIPHWETERRPKRVLTSPFIASGDKVWVLPWTAGASRKVVLNYLEDGRLPRPHAALPDAVNDVLNTFRQEQNRGAEKECRAALEATGLIVRSSVKPEKKNFYGISKLTGEIDTLCIDPGKSRIWVVEVKDSYTPYSAHQVRQLFDRFAKPGKYVDRLLAKVADIEYSCETLAAALGIHDPRREWTVLGLMVTRHLEPAALATDAKTPYCLLSDVATVVTHSDIPKPGFCGPSAEFDIESPEAGNA
ncbi:hypothetical protein [Amycolatopsis sp. GA6-003]|uniref:hypothetical protein n=1 Tax=Amycolatopsis sp. GA6-003 TaxID=2652444 RepID=UPI0039173B22